jgi:hypothetical protein
VRVFLLIKTSVNKSCVKWKMTATTRTSLLCSLSAAVIRAAEPGLLVSAFYGLAFLLVWYLPDLHLAYKLDIKPHCNICEVKAS